MIPAGLRSIALLAAVFAAPLGAQADRPIVVGVNRDFPPFEYLDSRGEPAGYDVDLIRAVAEQADLKLVFHADSWDNIRTGLASGGIDVAPGMLYSESRARFVDFCAPHLRIHYSIFVRGGAPGPATLADLRGRRILVERGSCMDEFLRAQGYAREEVPVDSEPEALRRLATGRDADAAVLPRLVALEKVHELGIRGIRPLPGSVLSEELCFGVARDRGRLRASLDSGLAIVNRSGQYREIYDRWLGVLEPRVLPPRILHYLAPVLGGILALAAAFLAWSWTLRRRIRAATRELATSEARFRRAMEATNDGLWDWDVATGQVYYSPAYTRMLGYEPEEWTARVESWTEMIHPEDRDRVIQANLGTVEGRVEAFEVEYRLRTRNGEWKWVLGRGRGMERDAQGRAARMVGTHVDITTRKEAEASLQLSEEKFHKVFHAAPVLGSLSRLATGELLEVNDLYCRTLGYGREELLGRSTLDLGILRTEERRALVASLEPERRVRNAEYRMYAKDGRVVTVLLSAEVIAIGRESFLIAMASDVTELKEAEATRQDLRNEVEHLHRLDSLGRLAGGVAHDMNNVLAAIAAVVDTLALRRGLDPDLAEAHASIGRAALRGRDLVKRLLAFTRKELASPERVDLNELVRQEAALLDRTLLKRYDLVMDLEEGLPPILGEAGPLGSALMNLCVNAVDAMPQGGRLVLRTRGRGERVELAVEDTGEGMAPGVLKRAMEPFFTTKPGGRGTGLGLAMVFNTARAHGGTFVLQSTPGEGTRAILTFPRAQAQAPDAGAPAPAPVSGGLRILLVDDEVLVRDTLPGLLEMLGHRVAVADGGPSALAQVEAEVPDLVILDLNMPEMNGLEVLERLRAHHPDLPVLLATGFLEPAAEAALARDPRARAIQKPFSRHALQELIRELAPR